MFTCLQILFERSIDLWVLPHASSSIAPPQKKWRSIHLHFGGFLASAGATLHHHYSTQEAAKALVALGGVYALRATLAASWFFHRDLGHTLEILTRPTLEDVWRDDLQGTAFSSVRQDGADATDA